MLGLRGWKCENWLSAATLPRLSFIVLMVSLTPYSVRICQGIVSLGLAYCRWSDKRWRYLLLSVRCFCGNATQRGIGRVPRYLLSSLSQALPSDLRAPAGPSASSRSLKVILYRGFRMVVLGERADPDARSKMVLVMKRNHLYRGPSRIRLGGCRSSRLTNGIKRKAYIVGAGGEARLVLSSEGLSLVTMVQTQVFFKGAVELSPVLLNHPAAAGRLPDSCMKMGDIVLGPWGIKIRHATRERQDDAVVAVVGRLE